MLQSIRLQRVRHGLVTEQQEQINIFSRIREFFPLSHVQCTNKLIRGILHFCYSVFDLEHFFLVPS